MKRIFASIILINLSAGCANLSPLTSIKPIAPEGGHWLTYDASRRGTLVTVKGGQIDRSCAEPAPDAVYSFVNQLKGTFKTAGGASAEGVDAAINATASALAGRDNLVLLARESLFRLCEARANGDISSDQYARIFSEVLKQVVEIAAVEKARSEALVKVLSSPR